MTNDEKDLLIAYLVDAGEIDPDGDVEAEFLDWRRVREGVVSGEIHYKAILEAARVRKRSFERGTRLADVVRSVTEDMPSDGRGVLRPRHSLRLLRRGVRSGPMERHERTPVDFSRLRRLLDHVYRAAEEAGGIRLPEPQHGQFPAKE